MKRRKKHLHVHQRIFLDTVFTRLKSAPRPPVLLLVVVRCSPAVPETEKTTVLCEALLYTYIKGPECMYTFMYIYTYISEKLEVMSKTGFESEISTSKLGYNKYFYACLNRWYG